MADGVYIAGLLLYDYVGNLTRSANNYGFLDLDSVLYDLNSGISRYLLPFNHILRHLYVIFCVVETYQTAPHEILPEYHSPQARARRSTFLFP